MPISFHFTLVFIWLSQDCVRCVSMGMPTEFLAVALGSSLTLNCTYDCSNAFVRGCWFKESDRLGCQGTHSKSSFCTVSLHLSNVSSDDLEKSYICYTLDTDDPKLPRKNKRVVFLQLEVHTSAPNLTDTSKTETKNASLADMPEDSSKGEFTGIKVLATVIFTVAMLLTAVAAYLCLNRNRLSCNRKGEPVVSRSGSPTPCNGVLSPVIGPTSTQSERVTLRIPTPDNESDTEVPYADIMITVRGISTPELTQVGYLSPGDQKERWGEESRSHLQASRSADRLHVLLPREVSRKMSTNSEYAVITYS